MNKIQCASPKVGEVSEGRRGLNTTTKDEIFKETRGLKPPKNINYMAENLDAIIDHYIFDFFCPME